MQTLYPPTHPYYGNVIGLMEDLTRVLVDDVKNFFATYYTPANASLVISGDIEPAKAKALVEKYFGSVHGRPKPPPVSIRALVIEKVAQLIRFYEPVANLPIADVPERVSTGTAGSLQTPRT